MAVLLVQCGKLWNGSPRKSLRFLLVSGRFSQFDLGAVSSFAANEAQRLFGGNEAGAS
jgi:hypothetical protein